MTFSFSDMAMSYAHLIQPLNSGTGPCGNDLIFSSEFDGIQAARRFDDPSLSQGEWVTDIKEADWEDVIRQCENVLAKHSKDLRIAVWLTEARGRVGGLEGLSEGYELLAQLCERFWEGIHPLPEEGDLEQRTGVLDWLVNQTVRLIREVPLSSSPKGSFSMIDQELARATLKKMERNPGEAEEIARNAKLTLDGFEAALRDTPRRYFVDGMRDAERLKAALRALQKSLDQRMDEQAPAFGACFEVLEDIFRSYRRQLGSEEAALLASQVSGETRALRLEPVLGARIEPAIGDGAEFVGPIRSRAQAIRQLEQIATFFRSTEPHSPVAYLADKAARWGAMSLHEWLRTVVKDDAALSHVEELLGVAGQPHPDEG